MLEYIQAMKNVASLLKRGGLFILFAFLNCTHYPVGNERFKCLPTTKDQVKFAKQQAVQVPSVHKNMFKTSYFFWERIMTVPL
jgi:hypothetical protein